MLQVFVAGTNTISIVEHVFNEAGASFFSIQHQVYAAVEEQPFEQDQIYLAKSEDYLVFKQSSARPLGIMPICTYSYRFDNNTLSCSLCEPGLKSYGLQDAECTTCMRAYFYGATDSFARAQFEQFCEDGQAFSILLLVFTPLLAVIAALLCCCCSASSGIADSDKVCQEVEPKKNKRRVTGRYVKRYRKPTGYVPNKPAAVQMIQRMDSRIDTEEPLASERKGLAES